MGDEPWCDEQRSLTLLAPHPASQQLRVLQRRRDDVWFERVSVMME